MFIIRQRFGLIAEHQSNPRRRPGERRGLWRQMNLAESLQTPTSTEGELAERSNAAVLKTVDPKGSGGSTNSPGANWRERSESAGRGAGTRRAIPRWVWRRQPTGTHKTNIFKVEAPILGMTGRGKCL